MILALAACQRGAPAPPAAPARGPTDDGPSDALISCQKELGEAQARALAAQCRMVSPATHPPCNAANSCALIRGELARGCRLLGQAAGKQAACAGLDSEAGQMLSSIERYYAAINAHDYDTAFALWGGAGSASGKTLAAFRAGFAETERSELTLPTPAQSVAIEGAAGSLYATLPVDVHATLRDGTRQHFSGRYVLRRVNDVDGAEPNELQWHIDSASLRPVP